MEKKITIKNLWIFVLMAAIFGAVLAFAIPAGGETIWSDGFEAGNFSAWNSASGNWTVSGGNVHSGAKRAEIKGANSPTGDILFLAKSTAGYKNLALNYWFRIYDALESSDFLHLEWSENSGVDWKNLAQYNNVASSANWQLAELSLPIAANNNSQFQFRLRANLGSASDAIYFDDFSLTGEAVPEPDAGAFLALGLILVLAGLAFERLVRSPPCKP